MMDEKRIVIDAFGRHFESFKNKNLIEGNDMFPVDDLSGPPLIHEPDKVILTEML